MAQRPGRRVQVDLAFSTQPAVPIRWPQTVEGPVAAGDGQGQVLPGAPRAPTSADRAPVGQANETADAAQPQLRRVLVGGVGYRNLRDMSVGPLLIDQLQERAWPAGVDVEDVSFGAVHAVHWLQDRPSYDAAVFVAATQRGRPPGWVERIRWTAPSISAEEVQTRVAEAVTGVISLDTLLTVLAYFAVLPPLVTVIEIEPRDEEWGAELSPLVQTSLEQAERLLTAEIQELLA